MAKKEKNHGWFDEEKGEQPRMVWRSEKLAE